ncbi:hypothetical protein R6Q57_021376 [Mikania cordata]
MADLRFVTDHNMTAFLGNPPERHSEFKTLVDVSILSPVNYAIMEHPTVVSDIIQSFWSTVTKHIDADGTISIVGNIKGQPITITKEILRECLQFGDKLEDPVQLDHGLVNRTVYQIGHEGAYPPTEKMLLHQYWSGISTRMDFNYSRMIFQDMHANIKRKWKERFLALPHLLQIVINKMNPTLVPILGTQGVKIMREDIFGYMKMNKKGKKQYTGERPLIKIGQFVGHHVDEDIPGTPIAIIAEEHNVKAAGTSSKDDEAVKVIISKSSSSSS